MKAVLLIMTLLSSTVFAGGKYKKVVIDEKKVEAQKPASNPSKEYAQKIKSLLKQELKSVDVHLEDQGSLKWLFVTTRYQEWRSLSKDSRKELVELLLRHMKKNYPDNGLKVSVGVDADQPLAEGDWSQLADGPSIKLTGE